MLKNATAILTLLTVGTVGPAFGQAWTRPAGSMYTKIFYGYTAADEQYGFDGNVKPYAANVEDTPFVDRSFYLYTEFGISNSVTVSATIPYKRVNVRDASFLYRTSAVGSVDAGLTMSINRLTGGSSSRNALSVSLIASIPTGYTRNYAPSAGSGQIDLGAALSFGRSFYPAPFYLQLSAGYQHRTDLFSLSTARDCQPGQDLNCVADVQPEYADQFLYSAEIGIDIRGFLLLQGLAGGIWSITEPETGFSVYNPFPAKQRYVKAGAGARLSLRKDIGISGQVRFTPYGANTIKSVDYFVGIDFTLGNKRCCKKNDSTDSKKTVPESQEDNFSKPHQRRY